MQPVSLGSTPLPDFAIILDVDGVLLSDMGKLVAQADPSSESLAYAEKHESFLRSNKNSYSNNYWSIVIAHHFSKPALANLENLIKRVAQVANPQIVISSKWRKGHTVEELKRIYFGMHFFAAYIRGKTPDTIPGIEFPSRGDEVEYWFKENPHIKNHVIFDDEDYGLSKRFKERFIHVSSRYLLSDDDVERALAANPLTKDLAQLRTKEITG